MNFFSPEDERKRKQSLAEEARKTAINDAYHRAMANRLLPETLRQIREAYTKGESRVTIVHENERIVIPESAPSTKWAYTILQELVTQHVGMKCTARTDSSDWKPDSINVFVDFRR